MKKSITFNNAGFYLLPLFLIAILGFWPSYFGKLIQADFSFYFHFHAIVMMLWVVTLIAQPLLIRSGKRELHRLIGKLSFIHIPLIFLAAILLVAHTTNPEDEGLGIQVFIPFKDLLIIGTAWTLAMVYRKIPAIHARCMIATGFAFLEPALVRFIGWAIPIGNPYIWTVVIMDGILLFLIFRERNARQGRWVFPLILGMYVLIQAFIFSGGNFGPWNVFAEWFVGLELT